jgi:hypothetical protein
MTIHYIQNFGSMLTAFSIDSTLRGPSLVFIDSDIEIWDWMKHGLGDCLQNPMGLRKRGGLSECVVARFLAKGIAAKGIAGTKSVIHCLQCSGAFAAHLESISQQPLRSALKSEQCGFPCH